MADMNTHSTDNEVYTTPEPRKSGKRRKSRRVPPSFASDTHGKHIRNAMTGSYYDEKVGSLEEKKFFKVARKSTFKMNSEGVVLDEGYNMSSFYYDSPEQYEEHRAVMLPRAVKDQWHLNTDVENLTNQQAPSVPDFVAQHDASSGDEEDLDEMIARLKQTSN